MNLIQNLVRTSSFLLKLLLYYTYRIGRYVLKFCFYASASLQIPSGRFSARIFTKLLTYLAAATAFSVRVYFRRLYLRGENLFVHAVLTCLIYLAAAAVRNVENKNPLSITLTLPRLNPSLVLDSVPFLHLC